jgi:amino acid adenylation domain-containing protein
MELSSPSTKDQAQLLEWSYGDRVAVVPNFPHIRFQNHVEQYPDKLALVFDGGVLTYAQLNRRANQLAHHLIGLGVGHDIAVAVCLGRSPELVTAYLGVLKAGGAVFPLSCNAPTAQLQTLLDTVSPKVLITDSLQRTRLNLPGRSILCLDALSREINAQPDSPPDLVNAPHHLAYLLATSGSTGIPKIVKWSFGFRIASSSESADDRHLLKSCSGTTFTVGEIMRPLVTGGTLFIAPTGVDHDPYRLAEFIGRHGITRLVMTPSQLREFLDLENLSICQCLRQVQCSGELVTSSLRRKFLERMKSQLLISYGCTEVPTATTYICSPCDETDRIDVGRPDPEKQVFVLDTHRTLSPVGVPGEIFLGGQMSSGYLNDPSGTSERFIANPFDTQPDSRLFRTGDRGRWLPNGTLEVLGRIDRQVKIRGFRVELGEIESHLEQHPAVAQCVAAVKEVRPDDHRLVAYWVSHANISATVSELWQYLRYRLPEQSVPSNFVRLTSLPLTPNGKLDRQSLPAIAPERPDLDVDFVPPRNPLETQLAAIWAEVLGLDRIGIHDNFFELGGHSLMAVRLLKAVEQSMQTRLPLMTIFRHPTIAQLAQLGPAMREPCPERSGPVLELLRAGHPEQPSLIVAPSLFGEIYGWRTVAELLPAGPAIYALRVAGSEPYWEGCETLQDVARGFVAVLRNTLGTDPCHLAGFSFGGILAFEVARQLAAEGGRVASVVVVDAGLQRGARTLGMRLMRDLPSMAKNLPRWVWTDIVQSPRRFLDRVQRELQLRLTQLGRPVGLVRNEVSRGATLLPDMGFDVERLPTMYRERLEISSRLARQYRPERYRVRLTLLRCRTRPLVHRGDRDLGWGRWVEGPVEIAELPGNHHTVFAEPYIRSLVAMLNQFLRDTSAAPRSSSWNASPQRNGTGPS